MPTDLTNPVVTISSPRDGATVGTSTTISASATDNVRVIRMKIWIDGQLVRSTTNTTSIAYTWNSGAAAAGRHTITVKAYDFTGNAGIKSVYVYR
jgi:hypothetical protein